VQEMDAECRKDGEKSGLEELGFRETAAVAAC